MCYSDFCDVFRCQGFMKILRQTRKKKKMNFHGSFTKIFGSREALYDLGINVQDEEEFDFFHENTKDKQTTSNALMTMPPPNVLRTLDQLEKDNTDEMTQNIHDQMEFNANRGSRPRGGQGPKSEFKKNNLVLEKISFQDELEDFVSKIVKLLEENIGRKIQLLNNANDPNGDEDGGDLDESDQDEEDCEPVSMQKNKEKCMNLIQDCISPLLIELADTDYLEMESDLNRQLCEYLTCDRYQEFSGIPNTNGDRTKLRKGLEAYLLMAVLTCSLALVLIAIYFAMWFCFWQLESQTPAQSTCHPMTPLIPNNTKSTAMRPNQLFNIQNRDRRTQPQQCQNNHLVGNKMK